MVVVGMTKSSVVVKQLHESTQISPPQVLTSPEHCRLGAVGTKEERNRLGLPVQGQEAASWKTGKQVIMRVEKQPDGQDSGSTDGETRTGTFRLNRVEREARFRGRGANCANSARCFRIRIASRCTKRKAHHFRPFHAPNGRYSKCRYQEITCRRKLKLG